MQQNKVKAADDVICYSFLTLWVMNSKSSFNFSPCCCLNGNG